MDFIGSQKAFAPGDGHGVEPSGSALRCEEIIIISNPVQVRSLCAADPGSLENRDWLPNQPFFLRIVLLNADPCKRIAAKGSPMIPFHVQDPFPSIPVMENGRVKAAGIQVDRIRPGTFDLFRRDQIIVGIHRREFPGAVNHGIDQIKKLPVITQTGSPDTVTCPASPQVCLFLVVDWGAYVFPLSQIP